MGKIYLFHTHADKVVERDARPFECEKELQTFLEDRLREMVGVEFIDSETESGTWRGRRIDTIGVDGDGRLVVIEYKLDSAGDAIKQGLDYIALLLHHADETRGLLRRTVGRGREIYLKDAWLLCVAGSFTFRDMVAAEYCSIRVELLQYCRFDEGTVALNWVLSPRNTWDWERSETESAPRSIHSPRKRLLQSPTVKLKREGPTSTPISSLPDLNTRTIAANEKFGSYKNWHKVSEDLHELFMAFHDYVVSLGEDVHAAPVKEFIRFRWDIKQHTSSRRKNLIGVTLQPTLRDRRLVARVAYPEDLMDRLEFEEGFTRDLRGISRDTYGELGITINNLANLERAKPLLCNSYELF